MITAPFPLDDLGALGALLNDVRGDFARGESAADILGTYRLPPKILDGARTLLAEGLTAADVRVDGVRVTALGTAECKTPKQAAAAALLMRIVMAALAARGDR